MIVHREYEQGSEAWLMAHCGIPTASEFDQLVTPEFEIRKGQMPATYLAKKLAEAWQQGPLPGFGSWHTEQGQIRETEAIPWLELEFGVTIDRVAFCTTDDGKIGCSPDGLMPDDGGGIEIKCCEAHTHVNWLLAGVVPKEHLAQVHGGMFVTGLHNWTFLSYRPYLPPLIVRVGYDEEISERLAEALALFLAKFEAGYARLVELNGGPPAKRARPETYAQFQNRLEREADQFADRGIIP